MKIYTGNLADDVTEEDLTKAFKLFGKVTSVTIATDDDSGTSRGFAYVEMKSKKDGREAIAGLHGTDLKGKALVVNKAGAGKRTGGTGAAGGHTLHKGTGGLPGAKKGGGFSGAGGAGRINRSGQRGS